MIKTKRNYVFEKSCIPVDNKIMSWTACIVQKKKDENEKERH